VSTTKIVFKD